MKKGFSLIELLVVIALIAILMAIAIPSTFFIMDKVKQRNLDSNLNMILSGAKIYGLDNYDDKKLWKNGTATVCVQELINEGILNSDGVINGQKVILNSLDKTRTLNNCQITLTKKAKNKIEASLTEDERKNCVNDYVGVSNSQKFTDYLINNYENIGLSKDSHGSTSQTIALTEYRYIGKSPDNYVCFGTSDLETCLKNKDKYLYRIIGAFKTQANSNDSYLYRVKLIKDTSLEEKHEWNKSDGGISNDWTKSTLNKTLNVDFLNEYSGYSNMIDNVIWYLSGHGRVYNNSNRTVAKWYGYERGDEIASGNSKSTISKVALIYPSDYGYATSGGNNKSRRDCLDAGFNFHFSSQLYASEYKECHENNWLLNGYQYTLSQYTDAHDRTFAIASGGYLVEWYVYNKLNIYPTFYLNPGVKVITGKGSVCDPYMISL